MRADLLRRSRLQASLRRRTLLAERRAARPERPVRNDDPQEPRRQR